MARRLRYHSLSAIYHVMLRGNDGQPIFFSNDDRCRMCLLLQEGVERFGHSIYSFCFMTNHIHLAIQVAEVSISDIIQNLAFRYTRYINKKYDRIGHLFQGRFKSVIVDDNYYLKELIRYIHLNPVRANLVDHPKEFAWSSHRAYMTLDEYTWLSYEKILNRFNHIESEAKVDYENFILRGIGVEPPVNFKIGNSNGIIGDKEFIEDFLGCVKISPKREIQLFDLVTKICEYLNVSVETLQSSGKGRVESRARAILAFFVKETENLSIEDLAVFLNRDSSGLSKLSVRLEKKSRQLASLGAELQNLRDMIYRPITKVSECQA